MIAKRINQNETLYSGKFVEGKIYSEHLQIKTNINAES
jgi:hypothetical protein